MTYCEVEKALSELSKKCGEEITFRRDTGEVVLKISRFTIGSFMPRGTPYETIGYVDNEFRYIFALGGMYLLTFKARKELYNILIEFAKTPEER